MDIKAGRELDALIAQDVMDLKVVTIVEVLTERAEWHIDNNSVSEPVPHYSTNIADAWKVVEKLLQKRIYLHIHPKDLGTLIEVSKYEGTDGEGREVFGVIKRFTPFAVSASLAICLAALKAVGYEN